MPFWRSCLSGLWKLFTVLLLQATAALLNFGPGTYSSLPAKTRPIQHWTSSRLVRDLWRLSPLEPHSFKRVSNLLLHTKLAFSNVLLFLRLKVAVTCMVLLQQGLKQCWLFFYWLTFFGLCLTTRGTSNGWVKKSLYKHEATIVVTCTVMSVHERTFKKEFYWFSVAIFFVRIF